jgi:thymidylate kinase
MRERLGSRAMVGRALLALVGSILGAASLFLGLVRSWRALRAGRGADLLLLDRCYLDEIVRVRWRLGTPAFLGAFFLRFAPRPDRLIHLDVPARLGWARKKASWYTQEQFDRKRALVEEVIAQAAQRWQVHRIDVGERPAVEVAALILPEVLSDIATSRPR